MTDGKSQLCRNGCGTQIIVSDRSGKWLPYNMSNDQKHDCPNFKKPYSGPAQQAINNNGEVLEHLIKIEELLEATLKNLGLFKTADDKKRLTPADATLDGDTRTDNFD